MIKREIAINLFGLIRDIKTKVETFNDSLGVEEVEV